MSATARTHARPPGHPKCCTSMCEKSCKSWMDGRLRACRPAGLRTDRRTNGWGLAEGHDKLVGTDKLVREDQNAIK
eukprot:242381-Chlamydomonas_euryale.AAC.5